MHENNSRDSGQNKIDLDGTCFRSASSEVCPYVRDWYYDWIENIGYPELEKLYDHIDWMLYNKRKEIRERQERDVDTGLIDRLAELYPAFGALRG
jgi:hypothetical protein